MTRISQFDVIRNDARSDNSQVTQRHGQSSTGSRTYPPMRRRTRKGRRHGRRQNLTPVGSDDVSGRGVRSFLALRWPEASFLSRGRRGPYRDPTRITDRRWKHGSLIQKTHRWVLTPGRYSCPADHTRRRVWMNTGPDRNARRRPERGCRRTPVRPARKACTEEHLRIDLRNLRIPIGVICGSSILRNPRHLRIGPAIT